MKIVSMLCFLAGVAGIGLGGMMFGDISIAVMIAGTVGILSGVGFRIQRPKD